jgi:hypothetical protein
MKNYRNLWLRNVVAFCLITAVFFSSTLTAFAKTGNTSLAGELIISGHNLNNSESSVKLDGENALSGRTVFSGSVITTENATATVRLGKLGYLNLSPNSVLNLSFDENSISGTLSAGEVEVFNSENVKVNIEKTGNAKVKSAQDDDDDDDDNSPVIPLLIFAGIVTGVVIYVITKGDDDNDVVSPVR